MAAWFPKAAHFRGFLLFNISPHVSLEFVVIQSRQTQTSLVTALVGKRPPLIWSLELGCDYHLHTHHTAGPFPGLIGKMRRARTRSALPSTVFGSSRRHVDVDLSLTLEESILPTQGLTVFAHRSLGCGPWRLFLRPLSPEFLFGERQVSSGG